MAVQNYSSPQIHSNSSGNLPSYSSNSDVGTGAHQCIRTPSGLYSIEHMPKHVIADEGLKIISDAAFSVIRLIIMQMSSAANYMISHLPSLPVAMAESTCDRAGDCKAHSAIPQPTPEEQLDLLLSRIEEWQNKWGPSSKTLNEILENSAKEMHSLLSQYPLSQLLGSSCFQDLQKKEKFSRKLEAIKGGIKSMSKLVAWGAKCDTTPERVTQFAIRAGFFGDKSSTDEEKCVASAAATRQPFFELIETSGMKSETKEAVVACLSKIDSLLLSIAAEV